MKKAFLAVGLWLVMATFAVPFVESQAVAAPAAIATGDGAMVAARARRRWAPRKAAAAAPVARKEARRWVYMAKRMRPPKNDKWRARWNALGYEGWEVVSNLESVYIFKRPSDFPLSASLGTDMPVASPEPAKVTADAKKAAKAAEKAAKQQAKADSKAAKAADKAAKKEAKAAAKAAKAAAKGN